MRRSTACVPSSSGWQMAEAKYSTAGQSPKKSGEQALSNAYISSAPLSSSAAASVKGSLRSRLESPYSLIALAISSWARKQVQPSMQATVPQSFDSGKTLISLTDVIAWQTSTHRCKRRAAGFLSTQHSRVRLGVLRRSSPWEIDLSEMRKKTPDFRPGMNFAAPKRRESCYNC